MFVASKLNSRPGSAGGFILLKRSFTIPLCFLIVFFLFIVVPSQQHKTGQRNKSDFKDLKTVSEHHHLLNFSEETSRTAHFLC